MNDPGHHPPGTGLAGEVIAKDVMGFTFSVVRTLLLSAARFCLLAEDAGLMRITAGELGQQASDLHEFLQTRRAPQGPTA